MSEIAQADRMARPVVSLKCVSSEPAISNHLCKAVERVLRQTVKTAVVRRLRADETGPNRPEDRAVELHITNNAESAPSARLDFRIGTEEQTTRGAEISLKEHSNTMSPAKVERIAHDLIKSSHTFYDSIKSP